MSEQNKVMNQRKDLIFNWLKDLNNVAILALLIFTLIISFHYFTLTLNQPLWWDEGEYASMAVSFVTDAPSAALSFREVGLSLVWAALYKINPGEFLWRLLNLFQAIGFVVVMYLAAKAIFNKKVAIVASALVASNAVILFFSQRLLLYTWAGFLFTLIAYFFYEGHVNKKGIKWLYASAITLAIGTFVYYSVFVAAVTIILFLLITEGFTFLKNKNIIKTGILTIILFALFMFLSKITSGFFHPRFGQAGSIASAAIRWDQWLGHFPQFPHIFGSLWIVLMIIGAFVALKILLILDIIAIKKKSTKIQKGYIFTILWFATVMLFYIFMVTVMSSVVYDAYIIPVIPAAGLLAGLGATLIYDLLRKHSRAIAIGVILFLVIFGMWTQVKYADNLIVGKIHSFDELRPAGEWIKQNTAKEEVILTVSKPQVGYYSQRNIVKLGHMPQEIEEAKLFLIENKVKFVVLSPYDGPDPWLYEFFPQHPELFTPVHAIPAKNNPEQVMVIIYKVVGI